MRYIIRPLLLFLLGPLFFSGCRGSISGHFDGSHNDSDGAVPDGDPAQDSLADGSDSNTGGDLDAGGLTDDNNEGDGDSGQLPETNWNQNNFLFRKTITLNPHSKRDRKDVPIIANIKHEGKYILRNISVFEIKDDMEPVAISASAWTAPGGKTTQVGFEAPGITQAGTTRKFVVYYNISNSPDSWHWTGTSWATRLGPSGDIIGVSGGCCKITKELNTGLNSLLPGRRPGGATSLELLASSWKVIEGFSNSYQLESNTSIFPARSVETDPFEEIYYDSDDYQAAFAISWNLDMPVEHGLVLAHRVFRSWPFVQFILSVRSETTLPLSLSSNDWNARYVYLTDNFDRMISNTRGDEPISKKWDTNMRWFVVYDSASQKGFGWFSSHKGVIRTDTDAGHRNIFDSYGYSAGGGLDFEVLWMASENKDEIVDLFDSMIPGVQVSDPESRDLNIIEPTQGDYYFPQDTLKIVVSTPGSTKPVTAKLTFPDGVEESIDMHRVENSWLWEASSPIVLTQSHQPGTWIVEVRSEEQVRQTSFEFRHPVHPRLLFSAADLPELRARKDGTHAHIWEAMLTDAAKYSQPIEDPGPGKDIRVYANRLINLALIQLMDPSQKFDDLLWTYFFKMLRYPNWTSDDTPFNNYDLTVGHFLTALAITYDWHYERLTPEERKELRNFLANMADSWLSTGWLKHYPDIDWTHFGSVTNNHYWIRNEGIAAVAYVLQDEVPEARRVVWQDRTEANLSVILSILEDDGSSNEGVAYHSYGQINLFPWIDMRDRALGGQTALVIPWFEHSILWDLYSITPGGDDNYGGPANFGDCPPYHYNPPRTIQAWLASRLKNGYAQWMAQDLQWPRQTAYSYIWFDPDVAKINPDTLPTWSMFADKGIFVWRSSWNNDAVYFSLKAGSFFGGHEQPDAGHFIIHKAGVPYVTDFGYSYWKMTDEHNLILVDGTGQYGQDNQWMAAVDPQHWASIPMALGDGEYFDLVADPTPMYQSPVLDEWRREVVGFTPGVFLIRDTMACSNQVELSWLIHSYKTDPPVSEGSSYSYRQRRMENPWEKTGDKSWLLRPQDGSPPMQLLDCSSQNWTAVIEPSFFVPEQDLEVGGYNENLDSFQLGYRIRRTLNATFASSLVAAWFGDELTVVPLSDEEAEGVSISDSGGNVAVVVWTFAGTATDASGISLEGAMGGRRTDRPAFFGRELTELSAGGLWLVRSQAPISIFARTEHSASIDNPHFFIVESTTNADIEIYCPDEPIRVTMDSNPVSFSWTNQTLSITCPEGSHRFELNQ